MKYKYLAWRAFRDIRLINIVSETDHYITTADGRKLKKITDGMSVFDTFEEAKQWLLEKEEFDLQRAIDSVSKIREYIERIKTLDEVSKKL